MDHTRVTGVVCTQQLPHDDTAATCLSLCPVTGNIAVASAKSIVVHGISFTAAGIPLVAHLYSLTPKCSTIRISICQDYIAYASGRELYVLQAKVQNSVADRRSGDDGNGGGGGGGADSSIGGGRGSNGNHYNSNSSSGDGGDGGNDGGTPAWMLDATITPHNVAETISREKCVTLAFDKEKNPTAATAVLRIEVPFSKSGRLRGQSKDEYATEERLGPLKVKDHGMRVAPDCGLELIECRQFLFRKFADNVTLHTLTLSPTYVGELGAVDLSASSRGGVGGNARLSMLHGSGLLARGVSCFFSHAHHGFMYDVTEETSLVANYVYRRETNFAVSSIYQH